MGRIVRMQIESPDKSAVKIRWELETAQKEKHKGTVEWKQEDEDEGFILATKINIKAIMQTTWKTNKTRMVHK